MGFALLSSLVAAKEASAPPDVPDVDIRITKWDSPDCSEGYIGELNMGIDVGQCQTIANYFQSFWYTRTGMSSISRILKSDDWVTHPNCKVIVYPFDDCMGMGWTPGSSYMAMDNCTLVPEKQQWIDAAPKMDKAIPMHGYQKVFQHEIEMNNNATQRTGIWMRSIGVICVDGPPQVGPGWIVPASAKYNMYIPPPM